MSTINQLFEKGRKKAVGFTLIELLVVITIISVLTAIGVVSYSSMQKKSRDARRIQDMKVLQDAFEQYYADKGDRYPTAAQFTAAIFISYLPAGIPVDPKNSAPYQYTYSSITADGYCICATLEGINGNATAANCTFGTGAFYCVRNRL